MAPMRRVACDPGFSRTDLLIVAGLLAALSASLVLAIAVWARRSLEPYLRIQPGMTAERVASIVGEPEYRTHSLALVRDRSSVPSFTCKTLDSPLPSLLEPLFGDSSPIYGPSAEAPLPEARGDLLVYFPFLYEVLVYLDARETVTGVFVCTT